MLENTYKLVYTFSDYYLVIGFFKPIFGLTIMMMGFLYLRNKVSPITKRDTILIVGTFGILIYHMLNNDIDRLLDVGDKYNNKTYSIVEGKITDFKPREYKASYMEEFKVNDIRFVYRDDSYSGCFHHSYGYGGPITHNGQKVKIFYVKNCIVKLWVEK